MGEFADEEDSVLFYVSSIFLEMAPKVESCLFLLLTLVLLPIALAACVCHNALFFVSCIFLDVLLVLAHLPVISWWCMIGIARTTSVPWTCIRR